MTRRTLPLLLALAASALAAGAAQADQTPGDATMIYRYAVTVEGTADYAHNVAEPNGLGTATEDTNIHLAWSAQMPMMQFYGQIPTGAAGPLDAGPTANVEYHTSVPEAGYTDVGECTSGVLDAGASSLALSPKTTGTKYVIDANVIGSPKVKLGSCSGALAHLDSSISLGRNAAENGAEPWTTSFDLPPEAVGQGKIIQLLDHTVTGADCPNDRPGTTACTLTWHAKLTFVKTGEELSVTGNGDDLIVPIPPGAGSTPAPAPAPAPAPLPTPPPAAGGLSGVFDALRKHAALSASGAAATLPVSCPAGCSGTATATAAGGSGARAAAARTLGRVRFTVAPGAGRKVTLRFGTAARRAIRRAGGVRVAVRLQAAGGAAQTQTLTLRLHR